MTQEQENFYRHSTVIEDETKDSFLQLLDFHLTKQGITLVRFIEIHGHDIYQLCYNRYPCCQCPPGTPPHARGSRVIHPPQLEILLDPGGVKSSVHNPGSKSAPHCCCPVNSNLQLQDLDFTLARFLLINFTTLVPQGSPERNALDFLVSSRNNSFAHAKEGKISNNVYRKSMADIEKSLLLIAKVYGKETQTMQGLSDIAKQPLNIAICLQLQNTLLQQRQIDETKRYNPSIETFKEEKLKSLTSKFIQTERKAKLSKNMISGLQDDKFYWKCQVCDKDQSVCWCHDCRKSMCKNCNNHQHTESEYTSHHIVQYQSDAYSLDYKFRVNPNYEFSVNENDNNLIIWEIRDIKMLHDDVLVIADFMGLKLVAYNITRQQKEYVIPLPGGPWCIAVIDNNTVAATLPTVSNLPLVSYTNVSPTHLVIVNVRQRQVIQKISLNVGCYGIMYRDNQLFVGCYDKTIRVMNLLAEVTHTLTVDKTPYYICDGTTGRIYYTNWDKVYCIDKEGNTLFTTTNPDMKEPWGITTDEEGHALVICRESKNVHRISPDGKLSQVIIAHIQIFDYAPIYYDSKSKSVYFGRDKTVYI